MDFEQWWGENYKRIFGLNHAHVAEESWDAAIDSAIKAITNISESHKEATKECDSNCDYIIAWDTAIEAIKELK